MPGGATLDFFSLSLHISHDEHIHIFYTRLYIPINPIRVFSEPTNFCMLDVIATCLALCSVSPNSTTTSIQTDNPPLNVVAAEERLRQDILEFGQTFTGLPYRYAGYSPTSGFDCSGFTSYVMSHFDIKLSRSSAHQSEQGKAIDVNNAKSGDLLFFRRSAGGRVFHVAIVYSNDKDGLKIMHSCCSKGITVESLDASRYWREKIISARTVVHQADLAALYGPQILKTAPAPASPLAAAKHDVFEEVVELGVVASLETRCFEVHPK